MLSVEVIREQLQRLFAGRVSLDEFEDWLVAASWDMHRQAGADAQDLIGSIELLLAEHSSGVLCYDDLIADLHVLSQNGCSVPNSVFIALSEPVDLGTLVSAAAETDGAPDYSFRLERSQTSPVTSTGSGRAFIRPVQVFV